MKSYQLFVSVVLVSLIVPPAYAQSGPFVYVANFNTNNVAVIDAGLATGPAVVATVPVPAAPAGQCAVTGQFRCGPEDVAITPDGAYAYVSLSGSLGLKSVVVISTALALTDPTNAVVAIVPVGTNPRGVAITPDGAYAYVANTNSDSVSVIDTALALTDPTNAVVATVPVATGAQPGLVAMTPDGAHAWVTEEGRDSVVVIDTALALTNPTAARVAEVQLLDHFNQNVTPSAVAISPDGAHAYVTPVFCCQDLVVIDTATFRRVTSGFFPGSAASRVAAHPRDVALAYVVAPFNNTLGVIDTAQFLNCSDCGVVATIAVGFAPFGVAITSGATLAFVTNGDDTVSVIDAALNISLGAPIPLGRGANPLGLAITPDLTAVPLIGTTTLTGVPVNVSTTVADPTLVKSVTFDLGNGTVVNSTSLTTRVTYTTPGTFTLKVTVQLSNGSSVTETIRVFVQSPAQGISREMTLVHGLGPLNRGQLTSLLSKLSAAAAALQRTNTTSACNPVGAFENELNDLVQGGSLTPKSAAPALNEGQAIQISLGCR